MPALKYGTTMRRTRDGRLMVRSLYSYEHERRPDSIRQELTAVARKRYPKVAETGFEHVWGGIISITLNGGTNFGQVEPGLYSLFGCNGSGILKFTLLGQDMAEEIAGEHRLDHVVTTYGMANRMPSEPFRIIGFKARTAFGKWQAGKDG